ncbi:MAG: class I SAM-dependent methyltransferase [Actinomycetota bacterium]|nr:class I SAM-dependent methyltransferase [Actinomycetota bacterium]
MTADRVFSYEPGDATEDETYACRDPEVVFQASGARRTVLCSHGVGPHAELLKLALPTFERFAELHGYDVDFGFRPLQHDRPPAWNKVVAIGNLLEEYDTVVWIDSDAVVVDPRRDILSVAGPERSMWMAMHHYGGEEQPNTGVLVVHRREEARELLAAVWQVTHLIEHPWWEQAAILHLLGYDVSTIGHAKLVSPTRWFDTVGWLGNEWNSISQDPHPNPLINHYAGVSHANRVLSMSRDVRNATGPRGSTVDDGRKLSVILPLGPGSAERALVGISMLASLERDLELVIVDDASELRGVLAAVQGAVRVVRHGQRYGLPTCWDAGIAVASGETVLLLDGPVVLDRDCVRSLLDALEPGVVATTATAPGDAGLSPCRASVLAARRADLQAAGIPLGAGPGDVMAELCCRLAGSGRTVVAVPTAVVHSAVDVAPPASPQGQLAPWKLALMRSSYVERLDEVPFREELPAVLDARGLNGMGAEIGVQTGLFSHYLLTYWGGRRLLSIDPWEHASADEYEDIANVNQAVQDERYRETCQRLAIFGNRSVVVRARSTEAALDVDDGSLDFVYLDARHDYDSVLEDLRSWVRKVRPGGIIAGHDYVDGDLPEGKFGVRGAVDEYFTDLGLSVAATTLDPPWLSWIVSVPAYAVEKRIAVGATGRAAAQ